MNKPPPSIDGARVLYWAWSGDEPFGWVGTQTDPYASPIYGLAIARYGLESGIYRFSCDDSWETEQDNIYDSVEDAMRHLPKQYRQVVAKWQKY
ncbi:MAG: hypothetical protein P8179_08725 [Candidatus Thiodiazotropha sp.]|jgi:hypothetical protein